jgi:hypothetical protein
VVELVLVIGGFVARGAYKINRKELCKRLKRNQDYLQMMRLEEFAEVELGDTETWISETGTLEEA